jgi:hypothetical protein
MLASSFPGDDSAGLWLCGNEEEGQAMMEDEALQAVLKRSSSPVGFL